MDVLIQSLVQANFAPERIIPRASMAQYTTFRVGGVPICSFATAASAGWFCAFPLPCPPSAASGMT